MIDENNEEAIRELIKVVGKKKKNEFGFSWQMITVFMAFVVSGTTGIIQLGTVQTHVEINTQRLDKIETHDLLTRDIEAQLIARIAKIETENPEQDRRIIGLTNQLNKLDESIEKSRVDLVTRSDLLQQLTVTKTEFLSEIKRLDQQLTNHLNIDSGSLPRAEFQAWKNKQKSFC